MHYTLRLTEHYFYREASLTEDQGPLLPVRSLTPRLCTRRPRPAAEYSESRKYQNCIQSTCTVFKSIYVHSHMI